MIKNAESVSSLYDLSDLSLVDNDSDKVIITDVNKLYFEINNITKFRKALSELIVKNLTGKIKTGDIILFADENFSRKIYTLITIACGQIVPYIIYDVDQENGNEYIANFSKEDVEMLSEYPMFKDDNDELIFFLTNTAHIFAENAPTHNKPLIQNVKAYLDKGFWATNGMFILGGGLYQSVDVLADELGLVKQSVPKNEPGFSLHEKDGKYLSFLGNNLYGSYELVKAAWCEVAKKVIDSEDLLFGNGFSAMFSKHQEGFVMEHLSYLENDIKLLSTVVPVQKTIEVVTAEIIKETSASSTDDFFEGAEAMIESVKKEDKKKTKKKREASFEIQAEVSEQEKQIAIKENLKAVMKPSVKVSIPKSVMKQKNIAAEKESEAILNSVNDSYPADWDYVYTVGETSRMYNPTIGQEYVNGKFILNENQVKGMSIEDWNAYFHVHSELHHLIEETIGELGGLYLTEDELKESGHLLYNPNKLKLDYIHEYIIGNVYTIIEQFENVKDAVVQVYGQTFYDRQLEILLSKRPQVKSITALEEKNVPYIHPLDEVVLDYKINQAANITFYNNQNKSLMRAEKERLMADPLLKNDFNALIEEFGSELQSLSITVFFMDWLSEQLGKLAGYGLPDVSMANSLYFYGMSYPIFAKEMENRGLVLVPKDKVATDIVTYSDYYEAKDSAKRFVNEQFQFFLLSEINDADREKIEYEWNKRYNGYVTADIWKLPMFIRHSKYFKDRSARRQLKLAESQITGIKFATVDNSSIMAHEVGYGKTLIAIGYMSHCFETGQASNFLLTVPKTLYVNRKWKEEIFGYYDKERDRTIIGATPIYNVIELGNFSTSEIWGNGKSKYKTYSEDEEKKISQFGQLFTEIGGSEVGGRVSNSKGTAVMPTNPYNYRVAVATSTYSWIKLIEKHLPNIDKHLFNRTITKDYEEHKDILKLLSTYNLGTSTKDKLKNLGLLSDKIIETRWFYQVHLPVFGPDIEFKGIINYDEKTTKDWYRFYNNSKTGLPEQFEKDEKGKYIMIQAEYTDANGNKQFKDVKKPRPLKAVYEEFLMGVLEELHGWIEGIIQKMKDFAIYEYGTWKFDSSHQNIILSTKEALQNLGFSSNYLNGITDVIKEITTYKGEVNYNHNRDYSTRYVDENGSEQVFKRSPEKVLQKQLQEMMSKISNTMTEEGLRGKFFLENLKIDGFILDEAHIAKKLFTNVKTDASVKLENEEGAITLIKTTSHDVKGGTAPETAICVFGICQYIKSLGSRQPLMLLTATPFSNQPTEIFSMLALVGIKQLREYGISNIKNFFDLFLKETLKYDFNHNGEFIKRITVEDFRNKELLINLIWSVMDIRRESSLDKDDAVERQYGDKPIRKVFPKLVADSSMTQVSVDAEDDEDYGLSECEQFGKVSTIAVVNKLSLNTCSIVDQNDTQMRMLSDIEKVVHGTINPNTNLEYTFDDVCPNAAIYNEIEKEKGATTKTQEDEERDSVVVALRTILNSKVKKIPNGLNVADYGEATKVLPNMKYGEIVFIAEDTDGNWRIYKKIRARAVKGNKAYDTLEIVTDETTIEATLKALSKKTDYGVTFKALSMSRAIALSPYLFRCNDLPEPTPENIIKYSPKLEYLVKALKSVKDYHINEIPKKIKDFQDELNQLNAKKEKNQDDFERMTQITKELPQLEAAREVSGQVVYMNMIRFNYYSRTGGGKAVAQKHNMAVLLKQYLVDKGWFAENEVQIIASGFTSDKEKENYIKDFQDGKIKVLFGTPAIKEGVDLQNKASTMYIMTPDWNPTDMRQVEGRIWRRDNENLYVRIVYVLLDQSVEVFIYAKLEEKSRRLQQIMKERNTITELEEMSLDPNQTKVALASDPEKRADIVTKLCQAVLLDQRNKINKSREELNRVSGNIDMVYNNIDIIKTQYLLPYYELLPAISQRYYDYKMRSIIDEFINSKKTFIDKFAYDFSQRDNSYGKISKDNTLTLGLSLIGASDRDKPTVDQTLLWLTTSETSVYLDILNGIEAALENEDKFAPASSNASGYISWDIINELMPMKLSTENHWSAIGGYLTGTYSLNYAIRIFKLPTIIYCYTDEMKAKLLATIKEIKNGKNLSRYDIKDIMANLTVILMEDLKNYVNQSKLVRPENYKIYNDFKQELANSSVVKLTEDKFDALGLIEKINEIQYLYEELDKSIGSFSNASSQAKKELVLRTNRVPVKAEILVDLGLANDNKDNQREAILQLDELFRPVIKIKNVLKEIEVSFLKSRGLSLDDLPKLVEQYNSEYDAMTDKINKLEQSRQKLIVKFSKTSAERKLVTIDQIVERFSESNTYLDKKLYINQ